MVNGRRKHRGIATVPQPSAGRKRAGFSAHRPRE